MTWMTKDWTQGDLNALVKVLGGDKIARDIKDRKLKFSVAEPVTIEKHATLVLISQGEEVVIDSLDGSRTIAKAQSVFRRHIDSDFEGWGLDIRSKATAVTPVEVHEMQSAETFGEMFGGFNLSLNALCFTQDQIVEFCEKNSKWLHTIGYGTLFLFEENGEFFVARVYVRAGGLEVFVHRFEYSLVWLAEYGLRIVVPQQSLGA